MKIFIDWDEMYPFYSLASSPTKAVEIEVTEEEHEKIKRVMREYYEVHNLIKEKLEAVKGGQDQRG